MGNSFRVDRVWYGNQNVRSMKFFKRKFVTHVCKMSLSQMCKCQAILSAAKIFYTIHSTLASDNQKAQTGLEKATGTIKRELGKKLTMYKIPDLTFIKDESIEYGNKIDEMLRNFGA